MFGLGFTEMLLFLVMFMIMIGIPIIVVLVVLSLQRHRNPTSPPEPTNLPEKDKKTRPTKTLPPEKSNQRAQKEGRPPNP